MSTDDPYAMIAYTVLDAVNICLSAIGTGPVMALDIDSLNPDAERALKTVHNVSVSVQSQGWAFNTEHDMVLSPWPQDATPMAGMVTLPTNTAKVIAINSTTGRNIVQRGKRLYDPFGPGYNIGEAITVTLVVLLEFEDLPQEARNYIAIRAARLFGHGRLNDIGSDRFNSQEEIQALVTMLEFEDQSDDLTWQEKNYAMLQRARHRRRTP